MRAIFPVPTWRATYFLARTNFTIMHTSHFGRLFTAQHFMQNSNRASTAASPCWQFTADVVLLTVIEVVKGNNLTMRYAIPQCRAKCFTGRHTQYRQQSRLYNSRHEETKELGYRWAVVCTGVVALTCDTIASDTRKHNNAHRQARTGCTGKAPMSPFGDQVKATPDRHEARTFQE